MTWFTSNISSWWARFRGAVWDSSTINWDSNACEWDNIGDPQGWYSDNDTNWHS